MKKRNLIFLLINAGLALLAGVCLLVSLSLPQKLYSQQAAERWKGESETDFAQLSCFMSSGDSLGLENVYSFRRALLDYLTQESMEAPENGSLFSDAWSAFGKTNVAGEHGSADAKVVAVGGAFFSFHPLRLLSGSYLAEDDVMDDRVLLDRDLAWRLFGGENLAGLTVTVGGMPFQVAGVVERDSDFASEKAKGEGMTMYMSYAAWSALSGGAPAIDCYELVMPEPVKGYAETFVQSRFSLGSGELVRNSGRYSLSESWGVLRQFGTRSMHLTSVIYPEWENAARCMGDWCALFLALAVVLGACPAVSGFVALMVLLIRLKDFLAGTLPGMASSALDRSRQKRWNRRPDT